MQISLPEEVLSELDRRPETKKLGRSAVVRQAVQLYLELDRRRAIDNAYARAYGGKKDAVFEEFADLIEGQAWPPK